MVNILKEFFGWSNSQKNHKKLTTNYPKSEPKPYDLDFIVGDFSPNDPITVRTLCEGICIFGKPGSGKTSGSGAFFKSICLDWEFGGVVLCAKSDEAQSWIKACEERNVTYKVVRPNGEWRFNFLDWELKRETQGAGYIENVVSLFIHIMETTRKHSSSSGDNVFWTDSVKQLLRATFTILYTAKGTILIDDIEDFVRSLPTSPESVEYQEDENGETIFSKWQQGFCHLAICEAYAKAETLNLSDQRDLDKAIAYIREELAQLDDRTRSNIRISFTSMCNAFGRGILRDLLCSDTTITPEETYTIGTVIILDIPILTYNELGEYAQSVFKYCFQKAILQRNTKTYPYPVFLWMDEAHFFTSSFDYKFASVSRSHKCISVFLSQNLNNFYAELGGKSSAEAKVDSLFGNCALKIFHTQDDKDTVEWAIKLAGGTWRERPTVGTDGTVNITYDFIPDLTFSDLMQLRMFNGVEAFAIRAGDVWKRTGKSWMKTYFSQNYNH